MPRHRVLTDVTGEFNRVILEYEVDSVSSFEAQMKEIRAAASALIEAPAPTVYGIIADYHRGHPAILPPRYFGPLRVEEGGTGAGTRISFEMRSFGTVQHFRGDVTEPEPGRRLVETYPDMGIETVFTVDPVDGGRRSRVTIATSYRKPGLRGWLERLVAPAFLRTVYTAELRLLAERTAGTEPPAPIRP